VKPGDANVLQQLGLKRIDVRVMAFTLALLLTATAGLSFAVLRIFERELVPELEQKLTAIYATMRIDIDRALGLRIPLESFRGMDVYLGDVLRHHGEIKYVAITDPAGRILYQGGEPLTAGTPGAVLLADHFMGDRRAVEAHAAGPTRVDTYLDFAFPIERDDRTIGVVHIGVDADVVRHKVTEGVFNVATVLLVALLLAFEFLLLVMNTRVTGPLMAVAKLARTVSQGNFTVVLDYRAKDEVGRLVTALNATVARVCAIYSDVESRLMTIVAQRPQIGERLAAAFEHVSRHYRCTRTPEAQRGFNSSLSRTRTALFIFIFAESLSYSFFPMFVKEIHSPIPGLSQAAVIGLPISAFWLVVAITQPSVGVWARGRRRRSLFLLGIALTVVGLAFAGVAADVYELLLWRSITALGYGTVLILCQSYILDSAGPEARTQGAALFTSVYFSATLCGTAIGGVIANQIGYGMTLVVSAFVAALTPLFILRIEVAPAEAAKPAARKDAPGGRIVALATNPHFVAVTMLAGIPARLVNAAFLFYLAPLFLDALGNSKPETARVMTIYAIMMAFSSPIWAKLVDRWRNPLPFVICGGLLSGFGMTVVLLRPDTWGVVVAITLLGTAQAFSMTSQITLVTQVTPHERRQLGGAAVLGMFRMIERAGSVAGPFLAAVLVGPYGYHGSMAITGLIVAGAAVLLAITFMIVPPGRARIAAPQARSQRA